MKFIVDQCVFKVSIEFLRSLGHEVVTAEDLGMSRSDDLELLNVAILEQTVFITNDKDFGTLVFVDEIGGGVIFLRMLRTSVHTVHRELQLVLDTYDYETLLGSFVVVEPGKHRIRNQPTP
jgi:predicted nuclease of predicted toxin-antitoxin system